MKNKTIFTPGKALIAALVIMLSIGLVVSITSDRSSGSGAGGGGSVSKPETEVCTVHTYGEPIEVSKVSCNTPGITKQICTVCGYEKEDLVQAYHDSRQDVSYTPISSDLHTVYCDLCDEDIVEEQHVRGDCASVSDQEHHVYCSLCGTDYLCEAHEFNEAGTCVYCEFVSTSTSDLE